MKIDTEKLEAHIKSGINSCMQGFLNESVCIGEMHVPDEDTPIQIRLTVTRDRDELEFKPYKKHFCVSGL